jgi:hypothetical protein
MAGSPRYWTEKLCHSPPLHACFSVPRFAVNCALVQDPTSFSTLLLRVTDNLDNYYTWGFISYERHTPPLEYEMSTHKVWRTHFKLCTSLTFKCAYPCQSSSPFSPYFRLSFPEVPCNQITIEAAAGELSLCLHVHRCIASKVQHWYCIKYLGILHIPKNPQDKLWKIFFQALYIHSVKWQT